LLIAAGLVAIGIGAIVLRSFGPAYRIGRLLAVTPKIRVDEAQALADEEPAPYVRVDGRLDSETDFEDEHHRPLVFRRRRIQAQRFGRWVTLDEQRQTVPFEVRDGLAAVSIDPDALNEGLVVVPREAVGTAGEVSDQLALDLAPSTPVRLRIDQVSSVEHAIVIGTLHRNGHGTVHLTGTSKRPLVLTTLEIPEAMRILTGGDPVRPRLAAGLLAVGAALLGAGILWSLVEAIT
jgi:hypothetical protein